MEQLTSNTVVEICYYLKVYSLIALSNCSKNLYKNINETEEIWRYQFYQYFGRYMYSNMLLKWKSIRSWHEIFIESWSTNTIEFIDKLYHMKTISYISDYNIPIQIMINEDNDLPTYENTKESTNVYNVTSNIIYLFDISKISDRPNYTSLFDEVIRVINVKSPYSLYDTYNDISNYIYKSIHRLKLRYDIYFYSLDIQLFDYVLNMIHSR